MSRDISDPREGEERRSGEARFTVTMRRAKPAPMARARTRCERVRSAISALHAAIFGGRRGFGRVVRSRD